MGTRFEILLHGPESAELQPVAEEALDEISSLDQRWSRFREDSEVSDLNRRAAIKPVRVSEELMDILLRAERIWKLSGGAFDVTIGRLTCFGDRLPRAASIPRQKQAGRGLELDPVRREVRFHSQHVQLDLGAIGKGYAIDCAAAVCREAGVGSGLIQGGTSTIYAFGAGPDGQPWEIGLPTPEAARVGLRAAEVGSRSDGRDLIARIALQDQALSLSASWGGAPSASPGADGHIIDPRSGRPVHGLEMAAVLTGLAVDADAMSTALLVGGERLQKQLASLRPDWRSLLVLSAEHSRSAIFSDQGLMTTPGPA
jgi:thiamine biosynthesis lipoprotein